MKKICALIVALLLLQLVSVFALAGGGFTSSPSLEKAPVLVESENIGESCSASISAYSYGERNNFDNLFAAIMMDAYDRVVGSEDLGSISPEVKALAEAYGVESNVLVASELFAVVINECEEHSDHSFCVSVEPTVVENFAGLLSYNGVEWKLVETELKNGVLEFVVDEDAAYTILLHDGTGRAPFQFTGITIIAAVVVAAAGVVLVYYRSKKGKNEVA